jgi:hypothetical protein
MLESGRYSFKTFDPSTIKGSSGSVSLIGLPLAVISAESDRPEDQSVKRDVETFVDLSLLLAQLDYVCDLDKK